MNLPFVGSEIGLISNSDIRFVGTLHSINSQEASVSLENVKSFGTEDRRIYDKIPASDQIFSFIKFKGSDIKDLYVISPPKEKTATALGQAYAPTYPITQSYSQSYSYPQSHAQTFAPQNYSMQPLDGIQDLSAGLPPGMNPYYAQQAMAFHQQQQEQYWLLNQGFNPSASNGISQNAPENHVNFGNTSDRNTSDRNSKDQEVGAKKKVSEGKKRNSVEKREINVVLSKNSGKVEKNTVVFDLPQKPVQAAKRREKFKIPDSEFDFASANAKFDKSLKEQDSTVYYQKSSFFDNISSEVKDRASANLDRKQRMNEEKSQNIQTFGTAGIRRGSGRGRGRSYRGRNNAHRHGS